MTTAAVSTRTLTINEVAALFGVNPRTIGNWVRLGRFPRPLAVSPRKHLWDREAVERVLRGRHEGGGEQD
jgi:predicted DNA-binding transcriptional regulator AlpA